MAGLRIVVAAVGLACELGLAGCQSNPEPAPLPSVSPSASVSSPAPSSSPSVMPPTMPAAARGRGEKSAKAFVRYYVDAVNFATATGKTQLLDQLSASRCESCAAVIELVHQVYGAGGRISSGGWKVRDIAVVPGKPSTRPVLDTALKLSPQSVVEHEGAKPQHFAGGRLPATFYLKRVGTHWLVWRLDRSA